MFSSSNVNFNKTQFDLFPIFVVLLVLINLLLKGIYIGVDSFWLDEVSTVNWSVRPVNEVIDFSFNYPNGPVYQIFLKYWIDIFGIGEAWVRGFSLLFGSLIIVPLMLIAKEWFSKNTAYFTALIYTASNIYLYYSIEARSYTFVSFLVTWSFYFFYKILTEGKAKYVVWFVIVNTLLLNTHLTPVFIFFIQGLASLLYLKSHFKRILLLIVAQLFSLVLVGIWMLNNTWFGGNETVWLPIPNMNDVLNLLVKYFNSIYNLYFILVLILFGISVAIVKKNISTENIKKILIILFWGILPIAAIFLVSVYYNPRFIPRYMLYAVPGLYLFVAAIIYLSFKNIYIQWMVLLSFVGLMFSKINLKPEKAEKWKEAIEYHNAFMNDSSITAVSASYQMVSFSYYYDQSLFLDYNNTQVKLNKEYIYFFNAKKGLQEIIKANRDKTKLILVLSHNVVVDPKLEALAYAKNTYKIIDYRKDFKGIEIYVFDLKQKVKIYTNDFVNNIELLPSKYSSIASTILKTYGKQVNSVRFNFNFDQTFFPEPYTKVVFEINRAKKNLVYESFSINPNQKQYEHTINLPNDRLNDDQLSIYLWQPQNKTKLHLEKMTQSYNVDKQFYIDLIKNNKTWMRQIEIKAKQNNISIDKQIEYDANWMYNKP